ncbi:MAG: hypothetical protein NW241_10390 [Bacteroidia bacterium]|nr:hypothetical protein [Bacteroidia bacterium]
MAGLRPGWQDVFFKLLIVRYLIYKRDLQQEKILPVEIYRNAAFFPVRTAGKHRAARGRSEAIKFEYSYFLFLIQSQNCNILESRTKDERI